MFWIHLFNPYDSTAEGASYKNSLDQVASYLKLSTACESHCFYFGTAIAWYS